MVKSGLIVALSLSALVGMCASAASAQSATNIIVTDAFGRNLDRAGVTLVDWDGYMANPAIKIFVSHAAPVALPVQIWLQTNDPMVYFDLPSVTESVGSRKYFKEQHFVHPLPVLIATAPSRNGHSPSTLKVTMIDANNQRSESSFPIHVLDFHKSYRKPLQTYISLDFSKDKTHFFESEAKRNALFQAAADWNYYIDASGLDAVPAGDETTLIWNPDGFAHFTYTKNTSPYAGYKMYAYGIHTPKLRSGSEGSFQGGLQHRDGQVIPLRRSGGIEIETAGNYNTLGWTMYTDSESWWTQTGESPGELYSIAHHEMGHAIAFNQAHPKFKQYFDKGIIDDPEVVAYYGYPVPIDKSCHLKGAVDPDSGKGAFGYDWNGLMPNHRWFITKLDLLALKACGFKLRPTAALAPLVFPDQHIPPVPVGQPLHYQLTAYGGIPVYNWTAGAKSLLYGLKLDPFTGVLSGTPSSVGTYRFPVRVQDYHPSSAGIERTIELTVR